MTKQEECLHPFEKLRISKFFIKDNGSFGGQTLEVLVDCTGCMSTGFMYQYRGHVPSMYVVPNSILDRSKSKDGHYRIDMEPTFA